MFLTLPLLQGFSFRETAFHLCQFLSNFLKYSSSNLPSFHPYNIFAINFPGNVVATTRHSRTNDLTTSKALSRLSSNEWEITRELDKEPSLYCSSFYITYKWSVLQQCVYLMSIHHASYICPDVIPLISTIHVHTMCTP